MTMQAASPSLPGIAWDDLRPDLLARFRACVTGDADSSALSGTALHDLLESCGLTTASASSRVPSPECLLLFGTEDAISRHFPFLKTRLAHRDPDRRRERLLDLPGNIPDCLEALVDFVAREVPDRHFSGDASGHHASLRDAALLPWLFDMALSRDYTQVKAARFVRDRDYVFLEYPRHVARDAQPDSLSRPRYVLHGALRRVLACLFPTIPGTMQVGRDELPEQALTREKAYFGWPPLRVEGRFFKIMATLPGDDTQATGHARQVASDQTSDHHASRLPIASTTMQAFPYPPASSASSEPEGPEGVVGPDTWLGPERQEKPASRVPPPPRRPASSSPEPVAAAPRQAPPVSSPPPAPLPETASTQANATPHSRRSDDEARVARITRILMFCRVPRNREEIQKHVGMNNRDHFRKGVLNPIIAQGLLAPTRPDKPNSPRQQYVTVAGSTRKSIDGG